MARTDFGAEFSNKVSTKVSNSTVDDGDLFTSLDVMVESQKCLLKDPKYIAVLSLMLKHGKEEYVRKLMGDDFSFVGAGTGSLGLTHKGCSSMSPGNT